MLLALAVKVGGSATDIVTRPIAAPVEQPRTGPGLQPRIPSAERDPAAGSPCEHRPGCSCRRPYIGRALVIAVGLELVMAVIAIRTGATFIGFVACATMAGCMWLYALAEIIAFYRVGLPQPDDADVGRNRGQGHRPHTYY